MIVLVHIIIFEGDKPGFSTTFDIIWALLYKIVGLYDYEKSSYNIYLLYI